MEPSQGASWHVTILWWGLGINMDWQLYIISFYRIVDWQLEMGSCVWCTRSHRWRLWHRAEPKISGPWEQQLAAWWICCTTLHSIEQSSFKGDLVPIDNGQVSCQRIGRQTTLSNKGRGLRALQIIGTHFKTQTAFDDGELESQPLYFLVIQSWPSLVKARSPILSPF